jgi:hypothetical protein
MKKYKYRASFTHNGKRYNVFADTLEELYVRKSDKKRQLENSVIIYDKKTTVDLWAEEVFTVYKSEKNSVFMRLCGMGNTSGDSYV